MKKKYTIKIPGKPMTLNNLLAKHWRAYHREKKLWFDLIYPYLVSSDLPNPLPHPISLTVTQHSAKIRDVDNCVVAAKYFNDTLVECGYLEDDTPKYIESLTLRSIKCKKRVDEEVVIEIVTP